MTFLPPLEDAARVSFFLADQPRWSVYWDKKHGLWRVAEDDPDSDLYAESSDAEWIVPAVESAVANGPAPRRPGYRPCSSR